MLEVSKVSKTFKLDSKTSIKVLDDVTFTLPDQGLFFIFGKSGSGKSTLLNILELICTPDSGNICLDGKSLLKLNKKEKNNLLKNYCGVLFQDFNLFENLTINENLEIAMRIKGCIDYERKNKLIKKYGLSKLLNSKINKLSGGEKQRVALIRALIGNPKIIFCDEPTGALDYKNSIMLMNDLKEVSKEALVIVVSHNEKLIKDYNEGCIEIVDGIAVLHNIKSKQNKPKKSLNKKKERGFIRYFAFKKLKLNIKKNLISFLSLFFGITIILSSISFLIGFNTVSNNLENNFPDNNIFEVYKNEYYDSSNSNINLVKKVRPNINTVKNVFNVYKDIDIVPSLNYFLDSDITLKVLGKEFKNITYSFYYKNSYSKNIYLNQFAENLIPKNKILGINSNFSLKKKIELYVKDEEKIVNDNFVFNEDFIINKIINQFTYLNVPRVYLPYNYLLNILKNYYPMNISNVLGVPTNYYELLINSKNDDAISSYSFFVISNNDQERKEIYKLADYCQNTKNTIIDVQNNPHTLSKSFIDLTNSLIIGLKIFLIIICLCNVFLIGFLTFSSFNKSRKETAILKVLGVRNSSLNELYVLEQFIVLLFAFLISTISYVIIINFGNNVTKSIFFSDFLFDFNFGVYLLIFLIFIILTIVSTMIPILVSSNIDVAKELKEE